MDAPLKNGMWLSATAQHAAEAVVAGQGGAQIAG